jgi:hypothetical protein
MITIPITIKPGRSYDRIMLGRRGENEATQVVFNVSWLVSAYGQGDAQLAVIRPEEEDPYPAAVDQDDDARTVTWTLTNADTAIAGRGTCELFWYVGSTLAKSIVFRTEVVRDIGGDTEAPEPYETWVEQVLAAGQTAEEAVDHYPRIENGTWRIWQNGAWVDTGVSATGPQGAKGDAGADATLYVLEPSASAIVYDPNAEEGSRLTPSTLTLTSYQIADGVRSPYGAEYISASYTNDAEQISWGEGRGAGQQKVYSLSFTIPDTTVPGAEIECYMRNGIGVLTQVTIPIVAAGLNGSDSPGGGTSDYEELDNLPSINGVELTGDKSAQDLGLKQVFWATYGTTTYSELSTAKANGMLVACKKLDNGLGTPERIYILSKHSGNSFLFVNVEEPDSVRLLLCDASGWSTGTDSLSIPSSASDVGAVEADQGVENAGKFMVVGSDGIVAPVTMQTWSGGSY